MSASVILDQADVPTVDPSWLEDVDIAKAFGGPPSCVFRYTPDGAPVVAFSSSLGATALVKANGDLVILDGTNGTAGNAIVAASGPVRLVVNAGGGGGCGEGGGRGAPDDLREAQLRFAIGDDFEVGYDGHTDCTI